MGVFLMKAWWLSGGLVAAGLASVAWLVAASDPVDHRSTNVSLRKLADSLHAVLAADRQAYAELVTDRFYGQPGGKAEVSEDWRRVGGLPVHAQWMRHAARGIQQRGAEFSYTLRSPWPLSPSQGPQTKIEEEGLQAVIRDPDRPFYADETLGGRSYFTAIYADRATLNSCVDCHNRHPRSPRRDFRTNDVMGALVIRVPLEF